MKCIVLDIDHLTEQSKFDSAEEAMKHHAPARGIVAYAALEDVQKDRAALLAVIKELRDTLPQLQRQTATSQTFRIPPADLTTEQAQALLQQYRNTFPEISVGYHAQIAQGFDPATSTQRDFTVGLERQQSLIVYGPEGCGKTRNAKELAKHYGLTSIVELEQCARGFELKPMGVLYLTNANAVVASTLAAKEQIRCLDYQTAMSAFAEAK